LLAASQFPLEIGPGYPWYGGVEIPEFVLLIGDGWQKAPCSSSFSPKPLF
jgi:hypothetical protein